MADETAAADVLAIDAEVARTSGADGYGLTGSGFIPKPFSRLLAEKLALARSLFGVDLDLGSGSAIRKILEVSALEDARTWSALAALYDNQFVATAQGDALSRLGAELGLPRPSLEARGTVTLTAHLPAVIGAVNLPRGSRMGGTVWDCDTPVRLDDVGALYTRVYDARQLPPVGDAGPETWIRVQEVESAIWAWAEETPALVINRPTAMASNGSKPYQSAAIEGCGFAIPETLITTDPRAAAEFWERHAMAVG